MLDRVPTPGRENRVKITQDDGTVVAGVLEYDDQATQEGSPYTKGNVLPDDVCGILGIDPITSEPKDAWLGVIQAVGYSILTIQALQVDGSPLAGFKVEGLTDIVEDKCYTDENGKIFLIIKEGSYTLSIPTAECIDSKFNSQEVSITAGAVSNVTMQAVTNGTSKTFTSSVTGQQFSGAVASVDVFSVGGGGGGHTGGGGGGYTQTYKDVIPTPFQKLNVTIGAGGADGRAGGASSFLGCYASGGQPASTQSNTGGDGGSGGGGGSNVYSGGGDGGSDGGNGEDSRGPGGTGQGRTTRAFGESSGALYAGGGGGFGSSGGAGGAGGGGRGSSSGRGSDGADNTGGGGGGGGGSSSPGGSGGSGVVLVRWTFKT